MAALKLQKIGNSYGFRIPKETLEHVGFHSEDQYELIEEAGVLVIVKRPPPPETWTFHEPALTDEDKQWLEADLGDDE
ncbi:MAG: AbrB/MazE/SpoVT family DNA-binding domain-containing protein [Bdellovibrionota bacterium]